ncbi:MAG: methionine--tRNA ligase [Myxococcales bacterium]|nr:methionine--tRNA ligase [Myxococcales bacterium]
MRPVLVTSALPYANGHIHIGHLVEYIQTDIWARAQRAMGRRAIYVCADDTHGSAIMLRARAEKRSEIDLIAEMSAAHQRDFAAFQIAFDHYGSTHSAENRAFAGEIWAAFRAGGHVAKRPVQQLFDPVEKIFLADRFVRGTCPKCRAPGQYGDNCDQCGATYAATELIDPTSVLSGATPVLGEADHYLVSIEHERPWLTAWTQAEGRMPRATAKYLAGFFLPEPLHDWDVSRTAPYFGFEIPDAPGHYFYVWFDAPIGYLAATQQWCDKAGEKFDDYWRSAEADIVHVIGKDIVKFHTLFWPVMLKTAGFSLPRRVQVHGFLTVNGAKMSKSKGTFVLASTFARHLDPTYLRYYYATKLGPSVDDLDLDVDELEKRVNAELVNKIVNLASRSARFVPAGLALPYPNDGGLFAAGAALADEVAAAYDGWDFAKVTRLVTGLADRANEAVDRAAPWALAKDPARAAEAEAAASIALNLFRQIVVYLAPVLPRLAGDVAALFGAPVDRFELARTPLAGTKLAPYQHLLKRVDPAKVTAMIDESKPAEPLAAAAAPAAAPAPPAGAPDDGAALAAEPLGATCTIDDFTKVDLRVARIVAAESVPEAKKLLKLTVSLGGEARRTVFAGIKAHYRPEELVGRLVIVCANLAPRQMKLGLSEGMVLAAGASGEAFLLSPDSGARPGMRVH